MIGKYSAEIKIVIFQSVRKRQSNEWKSLSNCGHIAAKIVRFNSVHSEIIRRKFTKFGYYVAWLLPLKILKSDLRSANPLSNAKAKSKGRSTRRRLYNSLCLKLRGHWSDWTESHQISTRCTEMIADYYVDLCDLPIRLETPTWRMKIVVKLRANRGKNWAF